MVTSIDGYIAKEDGDTSWMYSYEHYEHGLSLSQEDIDKYLQSIDCYIMGANTYRQALNLGWPYGKKPVIVLTSKTINDHRTTVTSYNGDLKSLISNKTQFNNIWVVGGPIVIKNFINQGLVHTIIVSIVPVILGKGRAFFEDIMKEQKLNLIDVAAYKDGMVELTYKVK